MKNEPAFPCEDYDDYGTLVGFREGMQLRDYFAAKAMQGFISTNALERGVEFNISLEDNERLLAEVSYHMADAMLKARSK